jgi:hypothetical protein
MRDVYVLLHFESRKFQKSPPTGRKGMYEENSDFRGKKNKSQEQQDKEYGLQFSQISSDNFQRHVIQYPGSFPTTSYLSCSCPVHPTATINPFLPLYPPLLSPVSVGVFYHTTFLIPHHYDLHRKPDTCHKRFPLLIADWRL